MQRLGSVLHKCANLSVWLYVAAVTVVMPFYFTEGYGYIGTDKGVFFRKAGFPLLVAAVVFGVLDGAGRLLVRRREKKKQLSVTDWFVMAYVAAVFLSYGCSVYGESTGLWGNDSWPMGLFTHVCMAAAYFVLSRGFVGERIFYGVLLWVTTVVFGVGILNRFGIYPIEMAYANSSFISTVGNINWFCGYWSVVSWISVILYWNQEGKGKREKWAAVLYGTLAVISLALGILQGSDSGILALAAVLLALFCASAENPARMKRVLELLLMVCGICMVSALLHVIFPGAMTYRSGALAVLTQWPVAWGLGVICLGIYLAFRKWSAAGGFAAKVRRLYRRWALILGACAFGSYILLVVLNTLLPSGIPGLAETNLFTFDEDWGSMRGATWTAGLQVWTGQDLLHRLVGVGPDAMVHYIYSGSDGELLQMVQEQFPGSRLFNAHGEWITNLANWGLFGMTAFAGIMISAFVRFWKAGKQAPMLYLFAICVLGYTVNNLFSFQTMMNLPFLFIMLGIGEAQLRTALQAG